MFNKTRIQELETRITFLQEDRRDLRDEVWRLEKDLVKLAKHLGLSFENVNERRIVPVENFEKFKQ